MKLSLMTLGLAGGLIFQFQSDGDRTTFERGYREMLDAVAGCGYRAVDISSVEADCFSLNELKGMLDERCLKVNSYIYLAPMAMGDSTGLPGRITAGKRAAEIAVSLGADILMLAPTAHDGIGEEKESAVLEHLLEHMGPITAYAKELGLCVVVEDTPDQRLCLCTKSQIKRVLDSVEGLELVYDSGNMILAGEEPVDYCRYFLKRIGHVHMKDLIPVTDGDGTPFADQAIDGRWYRSTLTGDGIIHLEEILTLLEEDAYGGSITIEFPPLPKEQWAAGLRSCRAYFEQSIRGAC